MNLLIWMFAGLSIGWLSGRRLEGEGNGLYKDIFLGTGGALIGGMLLRSNGFSGYGGAVLATVAAVACALMLTTLAGSGNGRKACVRVR